MPITQQLINITQKAVQWTEAVNKTKHIFALHFGLKFKDINTDSQMLNQLTRDEKCAGNVCCRLEVMTKQQVVVWHRLQKA